MADDTDKQGTLSKWYERRTAETPQMAEMLFGSSTPASLTLPPSMAARSRSLTRRPPFPTRPKKVLRARTWFLFPYNLLPLTFGPQGIPLRWSGRPKSPSSL